MKMYKQPIIDVTAIETEQIMQSLNVSVNGGGGGNSMHAPGRATNIPD